MKNIINKNILKVLFLLVISLPLLNSCDEEEAGSPPVIDRVSLVPRDSTTLSGGRGETLVIFGKNLSSVKEVYFSGVQAPVNTTLVRNDNIIIRIPDSAPFPGPNVLSTVRVVTQFGEAQLAFEIEQPVPSITTFSPAVASPGDVVTITGEYFNGLETVKFIDAKTGAESEAEVLAQTITEDGEEQVSVIVPEGVKVSYIGITTKAGLGTSENTFGFNFAVWTDDIGEGWNQAGWSGTTVWNNSTPAKNGNYSAKHSYTGGWGGFQVTHSIDEGSKFLLAEYTAVKVSLYGGPGTNGKLVQIYIQQFAGDPGVKPVELALVEGQWTDFTIPLSELGNPAQVQELVIQDKGMAPYLMFVDDLGFL